MRILHTAVIYIYISKADPEIISGEGVINVSGTKFIQSGSSTAILFVAIVFAIDSYDFNASTCTTDFYT
jgi:hypothetical protein